MFVSNRQLLQCGESFTVGPRCYIKTFLDLGWVKASDLLSNIFQRVSICELQNVSSDTWAGKEWLI